MLILTRLWTSFSHTRFLKRRHKGRIDTLFCLMDILFDRIHVLVHRVLGPAGVQRLADRRGGLRGVLPADHDPAAVAQEPRLRRRVTFSNFFDSYSIAVILYQIFSGMPTFLTPLFMRSMAALIRYEEMLELGL